MASALVVTLMRCLALDPWTLWPLQGIAVGVVAGAVGWCLDEPSAALVDSLPRGLGWRTLSRVSGPVLVLSAWTLAVWWVREDLWGHSLEVWVQGVVGGLVGVAWVTWRRSAGEACPGRRWALAVVPLSLVWAIVRPLGSRVPVFPYAAGDEVWQRNLTGWLVVGLVSVAWIAVVLVRDGQPLVVRGVRRRMRPRSM
ncbi:hypothetical protein ACPCG0_03580 [Propionibacteriaceae bacterium Y1923]